MTKQTDRRIVVTGAKGGTGRSIVKVLTAAGYDCVGVDVHPPTYTDAGYVQHDVASQPGLADIFAGASGVIHMGSVACDAFHSRTTVFQNLTDGAFNVLQACANVGIKRVVLASSMEVYGSLLNPPHLPITEDSPLRADNIYASGKILMEQLAADYARWHDMAVAGFRLGRIVYEDSYEWRFKDHTQTPSRGIDCLWCYVDARDVAEACRLWLESDHRGFVPFNVAAPDVCLDVPTKELIQESFPKLKDVRCDFKGHECPFDSSRLREMLGWKVNWTWQKIRDEAGES